MSYDIMVLGSGPAGLAAAVAARGRDKSVLVIGGRWQDSPLAKAERVDNYPGFDEGINGYELGERMRRGAERFGAKTRMAEAKALTLAGVVKRVETSDGTLLGRTIVLATGAVPRELGPPTTNNNEHSPQTGP